MTKVLVADDEAKIVRLLASFFREQGYGVLEASDGVEALRLIETERPALALIDLRMPGLSGLDVLRQAKAIDGALRVIVITAVEDEQTIQEARALGATDYVVKPFSLDYLKREVLPKVTASLQQDLRASEADLKTAYERLQQIFRGITKAFAMVLNKIDPHYTHEHTARSVEYATKVLERLQKKGVQFGDLPEELLLAGVLLHDIGKIFTPKEILFKPGNLNEEEWEIMRRHPVDGAEIIEQIDGLQGMAQIIRYHQEAYDGGGYPEGLKGEAIPIGARIATVVDAFDAMVTDRPYRKGLTLEEAVQELKRQRGRQFDPMVVDAMVELYEEGHLVRKGHA